MSNPNDYLVLLDSPMNLGSARLAVGAIQYAVSERDDAWFGDTDSSHPFSLYWCCVALSTSLGYYVSPTEMAKAYFADTDGIVSRNGRYSQQGTYKLFDRANQIDYYRRYNSAKKAKKRAARSVGSVARD